MKLNRCLLALAVLVAAGPLASVLPSQAQAVPALEAGIAAENITPFTVTGSGQTIDPASDPAASNPDGTQGGLWDTFHPLASVAPGQVTPSGVWGEKFTDSNANNRWDDGEDFVDDPLNTRLDPLSAGKYDGAFLAGFGNDRVAKGAFDPIWARSMYVRDPATGTSFVQVSLDLIGWFSDANDRIRKLVDEQWAAAWEREHPGVPAPPLDLDHMVVSHTHNHEAPDVHVGLWGAEVKTPAANLPLRDGTFPRYERYIELKIAQSIAAAAAKAVPAKFRFGVMRPGQAFTTAAGNSETLDGMIARNSCRTPWVMDDEVRIMHIAARDGGSSVGTLVNWGAHVESLEDRNQHMSSDFVHSVRETVESQFGGTSVYIPGAQGAGEIVGDSCTARWTRKTYDGQTFVSPTGGFIQSRERTYAIGRVVGGAAVAAVENAPFEDNTTLDFLPPKDLQVPINNGALTAMGLAGVIDKPSSVGNSGRNDPVTVQISPGDAAGDAAGLNSGPPTGSDAKTTLYAWRLGNATFATAPGELFPEAYYGLSDHSRQADPAAMEHGDYDDPNPKYTECSSRPWKYSSSGEQAGADTGRPFEPGIRQAQKTRWPDATTHFLVGYTPDLLGYIVPGYDFAWYAAPGAEGHGVGALVGEVPDPCSQMASSQRPDYVVDRAWPGITYKDHYQETNSAGSMLAPAYACTMWELLGLDPASSAEGRKACDEWNAWKNGVVTHVGTSSPPNPQGDPEAEATPIRHY